MQISALSFPLTPAIREHVRQRVETSLTACGIPLDRASVRLLDVNGRRGGIDKQCRVSVPLKASAPAMAISTQRDLYEAIDEAALRLKEILRRHFSRRRGRERGAASPART